MNKMIEVPAVITRSNDACLRYEAPGLVFVGQAADVIMGFPGGGLDGPYGMTEPDFEFEDDGEQL